MPSIPHFDVSSTAQVATLPKAQATSSQRDAGDYLLERWLPLLGPDKYALVCVLHNLCYQNPASGELVTEFSLDLAELAAKIGKSRATVCRLLQRNAEGVIVEGKPDGRPVPSLLNEFVQVLPQQRYSRTHGRKVQAVNRFKVTWPIPLVPGEESSVATRSSESQNETLRAALGPAATFQWNPALACACACPYVQAEAGVENLKMRRQRIVSSLVPEEITSHGIYRTIRERQPDRVVVLRKSETTPSPEKALGGGEAGAATNEQRSEREGWRASRRTPSRLSRPPEQEPPAEFALALAEAEQVAGGVLVDLLQQYGDPNPLVGMRTILVALVEAGAPKERLGDLAYLGRNRLRRFQLRGGHIQTTVPGYYINLMRNLANEARGKDWEAARMEREDRLKHEEILCRIAARGMVEPDARRGAGRSEPEQDEEVAEAIRAAAPEEPRETGAEEAPPPASAPPEAAPLPIPAPASFLPDEVEVAEAAKVATWWDHLPDPRDGQLRAVSMLWGFVRDAISDHLNVARRSQLEALTPKWDATRPRTLLLLCAMTYTARAAELSLRREIEPQIRNLLSDFFEEMQVVYAPGLEERT